ncbi:Uncharacterised protein [Alistipes sp. cv1]|nr:Uncharacterised protein [Faecalibacterium prausnitzii]
MLAAIQLQVKAALNYDKLLAKLRNSEGERSIRDQQNALITSLNLKLSGISKKRTRLSFPRKPTMSSMLTFPGGWMKRFSGR